MTKIEDKDKTKTKTKIKNKTKTKTEDKDEDIDMERNKLIQMFQDARIGHNRKNGNWVKRQIVWFFWNNKHISELCEKWIHKNQEYAYTRLEELHTYSGEVVFTREHKATRTKVKTNTLINIDKLQVFKDFITNR